MALEVSSPKIQVSPDCAPSPGDSDAVIFGGGPWFPHLGNDSGPLQLLRPGFFMGALLGEGAWSFQVRAGPSPTAARAVGCACVCLILSIWMWS